LSGVGHCRTNRNRKQGNDSGEYSFVNMAIENWSQLPAEGLEAYRCKPKIFRKIVGIAIINRVK